MNGNETSKSVPFEIAQAFTTIPAQLGEFGRAFCVKIWNAQDSFSLRHIQRNQRNTCYLEVRDVHDGEPNILDKSK